MSQRLGHLEIARGIGILLVVLGHNDLGAVLPFAQKLIYSFHIPLFFFLSGYFINPAVSFVEYARKRFHSVLKPFLFTIFLIYFASVSFEKMGFRNALDRIVQSLYGSINYLDWGQLWFLPHLFIVSLYAYLIVRYLRGQNDPRVTWAFLLVTLIVSVVLLRLFYPFPLTVLGREYQVYGLPFSLDLLFLTGFFFLLGSEVRHRLPVSALENVWLLLGAAIALLFLNFFFPARVDIAVRVYQSLLINTLEAVLGILLVLGISRQVELFLPRLGRLFQYLGNISLIILLFHVPIQAFWGEKVMAVTGNLALAIAVGFVMGVLGPLLIHEIFIRYNPIASYWFGRKADVPALQPEEVVANTPNTPVIEIKER